MRHEDLVKTLAGLEALVEHTPKRERPQFSREEDTKVVCLYPAQVLKQAIDSLKLLTSHFDTPCAWRVPDGAGSWFYVDHRWPTIPSNAEPLFVATKRSRQDEEWKSA